MATTEVRKSSSERGSTARYDDVACPFCGLLCDDLKIERKGDQLKVLNTDCVRAVSGFERKLPPSSPMVRGKKLSLDEAIEAAAALIRASKLPLYGGLTTGVEGMRAVMSLADRTGGVVDHVLSEVQYRNLKVLQTNGWITSTLTEVRNRADLIIMVGGDVQKFNPRFYERIVSPPDSMFDLKPVRRAIVFLGKAPVIALLKGPRVGDIVVLDCELPRLPELLSALRARLRGAKVHELDIPGITLADVEALAERCKAAKYGVFAWAPPGLDVPHADIIVQQVAEITKDLTAITRFAGLPLGGNEGVVTGAAVCTWLSGSPPRVSFASGQPDYDPYLYSISRMLAAGEGDLLIWLASFTPDLLPPKTKLPVILLATPGVKPPQTPDLFIPVGTPGVDHRGLMVRCDSVVSLPLRDLGRAELPAAADVLASIESAL
jgi:formylmethanofuran dehydrogenase subunit B